MTYPYFSFFPALPLSKTLRLGDWCIGTPDTKVSWRSERFQKLAQAHAESFVKRGYKGGAWMWHHAHGFDGSKPADEIWSAIRATICFVVLDANDYVRGDPAASFATSENAELYTQPIDEKKGVIAHRGGGLLKSELAIGGKIGDELISLPDATMPLENPVILSQRLANALFSALSERSVEKNRRIDVALEWHRFALSNPRVVSWGQRLISLKTGFEALSDESKTHLCGKFLRKLFEDTTQPHRQLLPWEGLLWSPKDLTNLQRFWEKADGSVESVVRSELEDWFAAFGEQRNKLIHEGKMSSQVYEAPPERPLSRYAGPLFGTADRLLRETVKALLGADVLLCARLEDARAIAPLFQEITASASTSAIEEDAPAGRPRELAVLLAELGCRAANEVELNWVTGQTARTLEMSREHARTAQGKWSATFGGCQLLIDGTEKDTLEAAGAEFLLPRPWNRCE